MLMMSSRFHHLPLQSKLSYTYPPPLKNLRPMLSLSVLVWNLIQVSAEIVFIASGIDFRAASGRSSKLSRINSTRVRAFIVRPHKKLIVSNPRAHHFWAAHQENDYFSFSPEQVFSNQIYFFQKNY